MKLSPLQGDINFLVRFGRRKRRGFGVERSAKLEDAISILGVPVPVVEIQVSLKKKIVWIVFLNRERKSASKDFPLDEWLSLEESDRTVENLGKDLIKAMHVRGFIDDATRVTVNDLDSQPVQ